MQSGFCFHISSVLCCPSCTCPRSGFSKHRRVPRSCYPNYLKSTTKTNAANKCLFFVTDFKTIFITGLNEYGNLATNAFSPSMILLKRFVMK